MMDVAVIIAKMETEPTAVLRERWHRLVGGPAPRVSPKMLRLALAWEIQARASGGLSRSCSRTLDQVGRAQTRTRTAVAGTRLVREWGGRVHVVVVGEDRIIRWDNREWRSLSEVARAITGTRWSGHQVAELHARCTQLSTDVREPRSPVLAGIVHTVAVGTNTVTVSCDSEMVARSLGMARLADGPATIETSCSARLTRSGRALRLVRDNGSVAHATPDRSLVRLLIQAHRWWRVLRAGEMSASELAVREGVTSSYVTRITRLAFLAPAVTEAVLAGHQRASVTAASLTVEGAIAPEWRDQMAAMLPGRLVGK